MEKNTKLDMQFIKVSLSLCASRSQTEGVCARELTHARGRKRRSDRPVPSIHLPQVVHSPIWAPGSWSTSLSPGLFDVGIPLSLCPASG